MNTTRVRRTPARYDLVDVVELVPVVLVLRGIMQSRNCLRATRRLSHGHVDGVAVTRDHEDAIDANLKFRKPQKQTLSQHRVVVPEQRLELGTAGDRQI